MKAATIVFWDIFARSLPTMPNYVLEKKCFKVFAYIRIIALPAVCVAGLFKFAAFLGGFPGVARWCSTHRWNRWYSVTWNFLSESSVSISQVLQISRNPFPGISESESANFLFTADHLINSSYDVYWEAYIIL